MTNSGAPKIQDSESVPHALHLRAEEKGTVHSARSCAPASASSSKKPQIASAVAFVRSLAAVASARRTTASSPETTSTSRTRMPPVVSVPVLSRHRQSTRASTSTAGSS